MSSAARAAGCGGEELRGPLEQPGRGRRLVACERGLAGATEQRARAEGQRVVAASELHTEPVRLLEVVADDLVVTGEVAVPRLEPVGQALVQSRAQLLRHRPVRDVADQHVVEPEAVVAGEE